MIRESGYTREFKIWEPEQRDLKQLVKKGEGARLPEGTTCTFELTDGSGEPRTFVITTQDEARDLLELAAKMLGFIVGREVSWTQPPAPRSRQS